MPSAERPQQGPVTLLPTRTHLPSPCAGDPSEGGTSSDGTSSYGAPPTKQLRPPPGVGPASDAGSDDGDEARRQRRRRSYFTAALSPPLVSGDDSDSEEEASWIESEDEEDESEDESEYCSESEDEEDEEEEAAEPWYATAARLVSTGWKSVRGWSAWRTDRTKCMHANASVTEAHRRWCPPEETHAPGFRVVGGSRAAGREIQVGDEILAVHDEVHGVLTGKHNLCTDPDSVAELERCLYYDKPPSPTRTTRSMRLLALVGRGSADWLARAPSYILELIHHRRVHFSKVVNASEVKCSLIRDGNGLKHSDGTGAAKRTAVKMIVKLRAGGTLMTQGEDGEWRFVQITTGEYVLLSTPAGVRLHCAAHLEFVKTVDGVTTFRAVKGDVLSLIVNLGPASPDHQGSFVEAAESFARGEGCTPPQRCGDQLAAKDAAWPQIMKAQREATEAAAAAKAGKEAGKEARAVERAAKKVPP